MDAWQARHDLDAAAFQSTFDQLVAGGYRLVDISGYVSGADVRYAGIWVRQNGPAWQARHAMTAANYQTTFSALVGQGYRLVRISAFATPAGTRFGAIWDMSAAAQWQAQHGMNAAAYQLKFNQMAQTGYRLVDLCGYDEGGQDLYAAIWEQSPGPAWQAFHGLDATQYQSRFSQLAAQGYLPHRVSGYTVGGVQRYAAIWQQRTSIGWQARHGIDAATYQRAFDDALYQGYQLRQVCGYATPAGPRFAALWDSQHYDAARLNGAEQIARSFMYRYNVPGLSLAISSGGRLVYARALGVAEQATQAPLSVRHRMRIASVSKPLTAAAIMLLVQQGRLTLARRLFGGGGLFGNTYGTPPYDVNERLINIEHLLTHTAGFRNLPSDPMFSEPARDQASLIGWVLDTRTPASTPGAVCDYSNFGFCVLGRAIEKVSAQSYADHLGQAILAPAGANSFAIGGDTLAQRLSDEVVYHGQLGEDPYNMQITRMDSHGGWVATTIDLLRFLRTVDGFTPPADLLTAANVARMTTGCAANPKVALGWGVDGPGNWNHNGALPGTLSLLKRYANGIGQAALINTRQPNTGAGNFQDIMMGDFYRMIDEVTNQLAPLAPFDLFG
jgi:CubicO group peptidase (beta-lactamase class C family)